MLEMEQIELVSTRLRQQLIEKAAFCINQLGVEDV
jgi:hypothetical protein